MSTQRSTLLLAAVLLAACAPAAGPPTAAVASSRPRASAPANQASPSPGALASPGGQPDAVASGGLSANLRLPSRLGVALPSSLVGATASARLRGEGGLVEPLAASLVALADGRIVSNNGGTALGGQSAGIVANNSGTLVSNHGSGWRQLLQATEATSAARNDRRTFLWSMLGLIDLNDQLIRGFLLAEPRLGRWVRFSCPQLKLLPPPVGIEIFALAVAQVEKALQQQAMAGFLSAEGGGLRLRLVALRAEGGALADGTVVLDLTSRADGEAEARVRFAPFMAQALGLEDMAGLVRLKPGSSLSAESGELFLSPAERGPLGAAVQGSKGIRALRRQITLRQEAGGLGVMEVRRGILYDDQDQGQELTSFGFRLSGEDFGLASYTRYTEGPANTQRPFRWGGTPTITVPSSWPATTPFGHYNLPSGEVVASPSASLGALLPAFDPAWEKALPTAPQAGENPASTQALVPADLGPDLLAAPEGP